MKKTKVEFNVMVSITLSNIICFIFGGEGGIFIHITKFDI